VKKILYIDLDNVLVDFFSALPYFSFEIGRSFERPSGRNSGIFAKMEPVKDAVEAAAMICF
jgi:hypothetical protein